MGKQFDRRQHAFAELKSKFGGQFDMARHRPWKEDLILRSFGRLCPPRVSDIRRLCLLPPDAVTALAGKLAWLKPRSPGSNGGAKRQADLLPTRLRKGGDCTQAHDANPAPTLGDKGSLNG